MFLRYVYFQIIEECLSQYGPENVFVSFNGGKDCTVLLHLVLSILRNKYFNYLRPVSCMYIQSTNSFKEVNDFIKQVEIFYNLEIVMISKSVKEGLNDFLTNKPNMKAVLMGTRRTDPYSQDLQYFQVCNDCFIHLKLIIANAFVLFLLYIFIFKICTLSFMFHLR